MRLLLLAAALACGTAFAASASQREDFEAMWRAIDAHYAYFEGTRAAWKRTHASSRGKAAAARTREDFIAVLEEAIATLHDDRVTISARTPRSPRRIPAQTDLWARWKDGAAVIESVRYAGDGDVAGVRPGDSVIAVDGVPVDRAVQRWLGPSSQATAAQRDWALRHVLAGPPDGSMWLDLADPPRRVEIVRSSGPRAPAAPVLARRIGEQRDIGYLRLRNLADDRLLAQLDAALGPVDGARALIVDLREASPGPRETTLAVLRRFATHAGVWQRRTDRAGKRMADRIEPARKPAFAGPLVVLVDRWTWGESEALAAGLAAVASARLVGTPMAGLHGELRSVRLPHSGLVVDYPGEKVATPAGTPRESLRPDVEIDLAAPKGGAGDPILYQALKLLEK